MSSSRGRPKKGEERPTVNVRVYEDLGQMLHWIARIEQRTMADIMNDLVRSRVIDLFLEHRMRAKQLKAAEDAVRAELGQPPTPPLPQVTAETVGEYVAKVAELMPPPPDDPPAKSPKGKPRKKA